MFKKKLYITLLALFFSCGSIRAMDKKYIHSFFKKKNKNISLNWHIKSEMKKTIFNRKKTRDSNYTSVFAKRGKEEAEIRYFNLFSTEDYDLRSDLAIEVVNYIASLGKKWKKDNLFSSVHESLQNNEIK